MREHTPRASWRTITLLTDSWTPKRRDDAPAEGRIDALEDPRGFPSFTASAHRGWRRTNRRSRSTSVRPDRRSHVRHNLSTDCGQPGPQPRPHLPSYYSRPLPFIPQAPPEGPSATRPSVPSAEPSRHMPVMHATTRTEELTSKRPDDPTTGRPNRHPSKRVVEVPSAFTLVYGDRPGASNSTGSCDIIDCTPPETHQPVHPRLRTETDPLEQPRVTTAQSNRCPEKCVNV